MKNPKKEAMDSKLYFEKIKHKSNGIIRYLPQFSLANFEKLYNQNQVKNEDFLALLLNTINKIEKENGSVLLIHTHRLSVTLKFYTDGKTKNLPILLSQVVAFLKCLHGMGRNAIGTTEKIASSHTFLNDKPVW